MSFDEPTPTDLSAIRFREAAQHDDLVGNPLAGSFYSLNHPNVILTRDDCHIRTDVDGIELLGRSPGLFAQLLDIPAQPDLQWEQHGDRWRAQLIEGHGMHAFGLEARRWPRKGDTPTQYEPAESWDWALHEIDAAGFTTLENVETGWAIGLDAAKTAAWKAARRAIYTFPHHDWSGGCPVDATHLVIEKQWNITGQQFKIADDGQREIRQTLATDDGYIDSFECAECGANSGSSWYAVAPTAAERDRRQSANFRNPDHPDFLVLHSDRQTIDALMLEVQVAALDSGLIALALDVAGLDPDHPDLGNLGQQLAEQILNTILK